MPAIAAGMCHTCLRGAAHFISLESVRYRLILDWAGRGLESRRRRPSRRGERLQLGGSYIKGRRDQDKRPHPKDVDWRLPTFSLYGGYRGRPRYKVIST
jgi:hypothetical protein